MIKLIDDLGVGALGFSATGMVTRADYEDILMPAVAAVIAVDSKVRLLYVLGEDFEGFESGAMWEDAVLGFRHALNWERIAVVSDVDWVGHAVRAMHWLMPGQVRLFSNAEQATARDWISTNQPIS
ncbi:MAG: STAS/SEC14 domain-containing protein [Xanthomonadales bacterium]|nr:STAS/SEC14 domain-containing protein [Xanthomonadales bacterium]